MKKIFLCPPWKFDVSYSINPWMEGNLHNVDHLLAVSQWSELHCALRDSDAEVICVDTPPDNCPDAVFIANAGLLYRGSFVPSRFKFEERGAEEPFFKRVFSSYTLRDLVPIESREHFSFEGAGDALFDRHRNNMWLGFGFRTALGYKPILEQALEDIQPEETPTVRPLQLVDPRFYHLDTCFCPLDTGQLLWFPEAFAEHSRYVIDLWYGSNGITVSEEDALNFACNAISIGRRVIMPLTSKYLRDDLARFGLDVVQVDMSQFKRSGGACKCLSLEEVE